MWRQLFISARENSPDPGWELLWLDVHVLALNFEVAAPVRASLPDLPAIFGTFRSIE